MTTFKNIVPFVVMVFIAASNSSSAKANSNHQNEMYHGGATADEVSRIQKVPIGKPTHFFDQNGNRFEGIYKGTTIGPGGRQDLHFDNVEHVGIAPQPSGTNQAGAGNNSVSTAPSGSSAQGNGNSHSGNGGYGSTAGHGAIQGAVIGAGIFIAGKILGPSEAVKKQATIAEIKRRESEKRLQQGLTQGQAAGATAVEITGESLDLSTSDKVSESIAGFGDSSVGHSLEKPRFNKIRNHHFRQDAEETWHALENYYPDSEQNSNLKALGLAATENAVESGINQDEQSAKESLGMGKIIVGFLLGLNPVTSILEDAYAVFYGKELFTEKAIDMGERAMAAGSLVATIATAGAAIPVVKSTARTFIKIATKLNLKSAIQAIKRGITSKNL
jgi:hypothetical protein